jgi:hypothetical protein
MGNGEWGNKITDRFNFVSCWFIVTEVTQTISFGKTDIPVCNEHSTTLAVGEVDSPGISASYSVNFLLTAKPESKIYLRTTQTKV